MYRRIRDLREDADLLQKDLAAYLQCTQVCYSYYESGKRDIPTDVLIRQALSGEHGLSAGPDGSASTVPRREKPYLTPAGNPDTISIVT